MAIETDFEIDVSGNITHVANTNTYTVLELHRWLQKLADDAAPAAADDIVDITSLTPSERSTDNIITLLNGFNINDDAAEYFYGGSITQKSGAEVYSGLKVLGAVNDTDTQLQVIQDHAYYDTTVPFWGTQAAGGLNGDAVGGVLMRILVKSRVPAGSGLGGADIDEKRIRVQARAWGDSYDFFNVTLGQGEAVAAIGTTPDAQNTTAIAVVQAWAGGDIPTNDVEGWQEIDINNGNGVKEYYSKWHYNSNALGMKATYEYIKEITGNDSPEAAEPYDMIGEFFLGITHYLQYGAGGTLTQNEVVYWGTTITYGTLTGTFAVGDYVVFRVTGTGAFRNAGKVLFDNGSTTMIVALEDLSDNIVSTDTVDNIDDDADAIVSATAQPTLGGGEGWMLAEDVVTDEVYIQLISGVAPVDTQVLTGRTSLNTVTLDVAPVPKTVPKMMLGSYTGSLIGAFGIGIEPDDLASTDRVDPLNDTIQTPPNNVTFEVSGMTAGDRILVGKKAAGNDFDWAEMTLDVGLSGAETEVDVGTIPTDAPASGILRITQNSGVIKRVAYSSYTGSVFTVSDTFTTADIGNGVMLAFIDKAAADADEEFTLQYNAPRTLWIRVREGTSATPMKTYEALGSLTDTGGSAVVSPIDDY